MVLSPDMKGEHGGNNDVLNVLHQTYEQGARQVGQASESVANLSPETKSLFEQRRAILAHQSEGDLIDVQNQLTQTVGTDWKTSYELWVNDQEREKLMGKEN